MLKIKDVLNREGTVNESNLLEYVEQKLTLEGDGFFEWNNNIVEALYWKARQTIINKQLDDKENNSSLVGGKINMKFIQLNEILDLNGQLIEINLKKHINPFTQETTHYSLHLNIIGKENNIFSIEDVKIMEEIKAKELS